MFYESSIDNYVTKSVKVCVFSMQSKEVDMVQEVK